MSTMLLRRILDHLPVAEAPDGELLRRYADGREEDAFAEILRRHSPLVLGVCRRTLRDGVAAEDAFQATFVQLARQAKRLRCDGSLAGWLHTVARRVALSARRSEARRVQREGHAAKSAVRATEEMTWREVREVLDRELATLPERLRLPLILCYLEDRPQQEAAQRLGLPLATLRGRLERGRQCLRRRLERYGLPLAAPLILLGSDAVSAELRSATLAAIRGGPLRPEIAALAAVGPPLARWKLALSVGVLVALLGAAIGGRSQPAATIMPADPPAKAEPAARTDALGDPLPDGAVLRLGTTRRRVQSFPVPFQVLPDGKTILAFHKATDFQNDIRWIDLATGKVKDAWRMPANHHLAGCSADGRYAVLSTSFIFYSGLRRPGEIERQEWVLELIDLQTKKTVWRLSEPLEQKDWRHINLAFFSQDNRWIITKGSYTPGQLRLWDATKGTLVWNDPGGDQGLDPKGFADGGNLIVLQGENDRGVYLLDRASGKERRSYLTDRINRLVLLSPDGQYLFTSGHWRSRGTERHVYETSTGKQFKSLGGHPADAQPTLAISADGKTIATGGDNHVRIWDWPSGKLRKEFSLNIGSPGRIALSPDGSTLLATGWFGNAIYPYDTATGEVKNPLVEGHGGAVEGVVGTKGRLASVGRDKTIRVWDSSNGQIVQTIPMNDHPAWKPLAVSPDGRLAAVLMLDESSVRLYDLLTGKLAGSIKVQRD